MKLEHLTLRELRARPVLLPLQRPIVARIATIRHWPVILIDLHTEEGVTGRAYLEPYVPKATKYLVPALHDLGEMLTGKRVSPVEFYQAARRSLHFVGYEGMSMIAASGLDMAAWDTLARAADVPLAVLLGGSTGRVHAYNSNGLWLQTPEAVAEEAVQLRDQGGFDAIKLRLGRASLGEDLRTVALVREAVGEGVKLMVDFNQGLDYAEALHRCHAIDDLNLAWIEEPLVYDNYDGYARLTAQIKTPIQIGENFYGPRELWKALKAQACDLVMPDFMRIGGITGWLQAAGVCAAAGVPISTHLYVPVGAQVLRVSESAHWLEWQDWVHPILQEPYAVANGDVLLPERPGLGLDWDEAAVRHYAQN